MLKLYIYLILINLSFHVSAKWQKDDSYLSVSYSNAYTELDIDSDSRSQNQSVSINFSKMTLGEGKGISFAGALAPTLQSIEHADTSHNTDYFISTDAILFLADNSDISITLSQSENLVNVSKELNNLLILDQITVINETKNIGMNYILGKDKSSFYTEFGYTYQNNISNDNLTKVNVENSSFYRTNIKSLWRQTESTLWGIRLELDKTNKNIYLTENDYEVNNYYFTNVTSFFKRSQITTNLGLTKTSEKKAFSWRATLHTYISDHLNLVVSSNRKFDFSLENNSDEELSTNFSLALHYEPVDYIQIDLRALKDDRSNSSVKSISRDKFTLNTQVKYLDDWTISTAIYLEELYQFNSRDLISQKKLAFMVAKTLI